MNPVPPFVLGQLRHLYMQMVQGYVTKPAMAAEGLLAPQIAALEQLEVGAPKVKALVWTRQTYGSGDCSTASIGSLSLFAVDRLNAESWMLRSCLAVSPASWGSAPLPPHSLHRTLEAAKAAAQAEWEA